ncbi:hypothetical protein [Patulibacter minatonensis]|uniref:hypothetical protein n=1 Tax=Patulibacter minatonensis TaxID=298163 RepID=UPI000684A0FC|nr:hypothetical protein [Patulibacter minatonensis]
MPSRLPDYDALLAISARGAWDPDAIDLGLDRARWDALPGEVRDRLRGLLAGFVVGEEAVALHLVPFEDATGDPGLRACLAAQVVEEERHAHACRRAWAAMTSADADPAPDAPDALVGLFRERLPAAASAAGDDLTGAVALYHGLLEGVVFLAGQRTVRALAERWALPGLLETFARIERDERWHVALGARVLVDADDGPSVARRLQAEAEDAARCWGALVDDDVRTSVVAAVDRRLRAVGLLERPVARTG